MNKRDVVKAALTGSDPPYVPWSFRFTREPAEALCAHFACAPDEIIAHTGCHILELGSDIGFFEDHAGSGHRTRRQDLERVGPD